MNIAIATSEFVSEKIFDGGLANYTYKLAKWLLSKGHTVTVYLSAEENKKHISYHFDGIHIVKVKNKDYAWLLRYYLEKLKIGFLYKKKLRYHLKFIQAAYAINKKIREDNNNNKIDLIHYPHLGGLANFKPKKIPGIVRLSSSTALCQEKGGYGSTDLQIQIQIYFEVKAMKKVNAVFGPSKAIAAITEPLIKRKIKIIETPYVKPEADLDQTVYNQLLNGKKYILFFGSIGLIKGVGTIAEIIYPLLEQNPDIYYVFAGKQLDNTINNKSVWDYLIEKAGSLKDRIIYISSLKHAALFPVIQNAELVTLPSRTDNFPNTCIEAMANSKIVIGTKGNGFDQLINDGENGFVIDADDHAALLKKINEVLRLSPERKKEIELKAAQRIEKLNPDIVLNELLDLYKEVIDPSLRSG